jgi:hypothetical protein
MFIFINYTDKWANIELANGKGRGMALQSYRKESSDPAMAPLRLAEKYADNLAELLKIKTNKIVRQKVG